MAGFFGKLFGGWRGESRDDLVLRLLAESLNEISGGGPLRAEPCMARERSPS